MQISAREEGTVRVVTPVGSVDALNAGDFQAFLDVQIDDGGDSLVVDLGQIEFMSSAGLRAILTVSRHVRQAGGDLRLVEGTPPVQKVLELTGFPGVMQMFPTVSEAVASFAAE